MKTKELIENIRSRERLENDLDTIVQWCKDNQWIIVCYNNKQAQKISHEVVVKWAKIRVISIEWFDRVIKKDIMWWFAFEGLMEYDIKILTDIMLYHRMKDLKIAYTSAIWINKN